MQKFKFGIAGVARCPDPPVRPFASKWDNIATATLSLLTLRMLLVFWGAHSLSSGVPFAHVRTTLLVATPSLKPASTHNNRVESVPLHQLRQLSEVGGDAPGFIAAQPSAAICRGIGGEAEVRDLRLKRR
jgi:hypothetical protein